MRGAQRRRALPELARLHDKRELGIDTLKVLLLLAHNMRIVWSQQNKALLTGAPLAAAAGAAAAAAAAGAAAVGLIVVCEAAPEGAAAGDALLPANNRG